MLPVKKALGKGSNEADLDKQANNCFGSGNECLRIAGLELIREKPRP
jgi:hypothetical protein